MRFSKNSFPLAVLLVTLTALVSCQMQTLFTGSMGNTNLQINLPRALPTGTNSVEPSGGTASRLLLTNSGLLSVVVRQGGSIVTTQNYPIASGATSIQVSLTLQQGKDYVIEADAIDTQNGTTVCQGFINYNSTKSGSVVSLAMLPYSAGKFPLLNSSSYSIVRIAVNANASYTAQIDMQGQFGVVIPTISGFETHIQESDGRAVSGVADSAGNLVFYTSDLRNPNLPLYLTYFNNNGKNLILSSSLAFPKTINIVYNGNEPKDKPYATGLKSLLESRLFKANSVSGTPTLWNVYLIEQGSIPFNYPSNLNLYGGVVLMTPGTTYNTSSQTNMIRSLLDASCGFVTVGWAVNTLDVFAFNYAGWGYSDQDPMGITSVNYTGIPTDKTLSVFSNTAWSSPLSSTATPSAGVATQWNSNGDTFVGYSAYRNAPPNNGFLYAQDTILTSYYQVVSQGRFMQIGMPNLPDTVVGQVFMTNLLSSMAK